MNPRNAFAPISALAVFAVGLILALVVCREAGLVPLVLAAALLVPLFSFARFNLTNLALSFILADHLCQFLKRAIFLLGPQQRFVYYGFQTLPAVILGIAAASALFFIAKDKWPLSVKILILWGFLGVFNTAISSRSNPLTGIISATAATWPLLAIFVGMAMPSTAWRSISRLFLWLIVISAIYGFVQYFGGYTIFDKAWALGTHAYSIQASKVYAVLTGETTEVRAYSYYADHLTWGLFLVTALLFISASVSARVAPKRWVYIALIPALTGIVLCATRTVSVALLGALIIHKIISRRGFRRPLLVMASVFASFGLVLWLGGYLLTHNIFSGVVSSRLLQRYETTGTISARVSAPDLFIEMLPTHLLLGEGYASTGYYRETEHYQAFRKEAYSHNVIVDTLLTTGLVGVAVIILFLYAWLREAFWVVRSSALLHAKALRWLIAATVGLVLTGGLNGGSFLSPYFFLLVGIVSGEWCRLHAARTRIALDFALSERSRIEALAQRV
jgi:hypothetical protein